MLIQLYNMWNLYQLLVTIHGIYTAYTILCYSYYYTSNLFFTIYNINPYKIKLLTY